MTPLDVLDALPPGDGPHAAAATPAETARRLSLSGVRRSVWESLQEHDARTAQRSAGGAEADDEDGAAMLEKPEQRSARRTRRAPEPALFEDEADRRAAAAVRRHLKVLAAAGVVREVAPGQWMRDEAAIARRTGRRGVVRLGDEPVEPRRLRVVPGPTVSVSAAGAEVTASASAVVRAPTSKRTGLPEHVIGAWDYQMRFGRPARGRGGKPLLAGLVDVRTGREVDL
jgi:hypothetical protein